MEEKDLLMKSEVEDLGFLLSLHSNDIPINVFEVAESLGFSMFPVNIRNSEIKRKVALLSYNNENEDFKNVFNSEQFIAYDVEATEEEIRIAVGDLLMNFFIDNKDNYNEEGIVDTKNYLINSTIYPERYELVMPKAEFLLEYRKNFDKRLDFDQILENIAYYFGVPVYSVIDRMVSLELEVPKYRIDSVKDIYKLVLNSQKLKNKYSA